MNTNSLLLLSAQGQASNISLLNQAQSQFLLGLVSRSRANVVRATMQHFQHSRGANQNVVTGNYGAVQTGAQNANPLNVN
jgi:hypothetical protein